MGQIKIGNNTINNIKLGSTQVQKVYLGSNLIWQLGTVEYSHELQAIINRANLEGFTLPSASTLLHMDTLITSLKSIGIWSKIDCIWNFAYNDSSLINFSRIRWNNPTAALANYIGGVNYDTLGIMGNGVDGYVSTLFFPGSNGVNYTLNNASRTVVVTKAPTIGNVIDGSTGSANNVMFFANSTAHRINSTNTLNNVAWIQTTVGTKSINRDNSTDVRLYNNGTEFLRTATSTILPTNVQTLFRSSSSYSNTQVGYYMLGAGISATELANFTSAYNTFLTNIGLTPVA